jgi:hypothetical protein
MGPRKYRGVPGAAQLGLADRRMPSAGFLVAWRAILAALPAAIGALKSSRYRPRNSAHCYSKMSAVTRLENGTASVWGHWQPSREAVRFFPPCNHMRRAKE